MTETNDDGWSMVTALLDALGRALVCFDERFRIVHLSASLDALLGEGSTTRLLGQPIESLLGNDLMGPGALLRDALARGQTREGWRAIVDPHGRQLVMSVSVARRPASLDKFPACAPVYGFAVLRPADSDPAVASGSGFAFGGMIARSSAMTRIFQLVENLRHSDATILLTGESGTGKEVLARAIHLHSRRSGGPFIAVNCGALPADLLESEMFGFVKGAFTGADRDRPGRFELASGGTLFLDEIGDMPLPLQVKLLRVLQDHRFERLGDGRTRESDVRVIAATHIELRRAVKNEKFREDLYYRLRVVPIEIPPLRSRREDIEPLIRHLLAQVSQRQGREQRLSPDALRSLIGHDWPGNVRELENALEYAVAVGRGHTIQLEDLPDEIRRPSTTNIRHPDESVTGRDSELLAALEEHHWNRAATARALGISRTTLWRRLRAAGVAVHP